MKEDLARNLTIENAQKIVADIKEYVDTAENPVIDLSVVEKIDLSGIQLLIAAQKTGEKRKKPLFFTGEIKKSVYDRIFKSGFNVVHLENSDELFNIRRNSSEL